MNPIKQEDGSKTPLPSIEYQQSLIIPQPPMANQAFGSNQPWWIPTNEDNNEAYSKWYETAYKAALDQTSKDKESLEKKKMKHLKRKQEVVDFKVDAEKIADAQKQLSELMKPLKCDLCNAVMNTTLQASNHYKGKPHQKKVSMFLNQSAKRIKIDDGPVSSSSESNSHCEVCKIWFTSETDATQHYAGKKHNKAAYGVVKKKSTPGILDDPKQVPYDPRFGIGMGFEPNTLIAQPQLISETFNMHAPPASPFLEPTVQQKISLLCDLCGIKVNRIDQLEFHFKGSKHIKQLKMRGVPVNTENVPAVKITDFSSYRTPSGLYYCAPCNLSLGTEVLFAQHIDSKKHKNSVNPKLQTKKPENSKKT